MSMLEAVRDWLWQCPLLAEKRIDTDYLPERPGSVALESSTDRVLETYIDGSSKRRFEFLISVRPVYGDDISANLANLEFLERLSGWIDGSGTLPGLGGGRRVFSVSVIDSGYVYYADAVSAKYQLKVGVVYFSA